MEIWPSLPGETEVRTRFRDAQGVLSSLYNAEAKNARIIVISITLHRSGPKLPRSIAGPTGPEKAKLALRLAEHFQGEIINCDSVQVFKYFNIGTAKLPEHEWRGIPDHLIDALEPDQVFTGR